MGLERSPELRPFCGANLVPSAKETDGLLALARLDVRGMGNGVEASSGGGKGLPGRLASGDSSWAIGTVSGRGENRGAPAGYTALIFYLGCRIFPDASRCGREE